MWQSRRDTLTVTGAHVRIAHPSVGVQFTATIGDR